MGLILLVIFAAAVLLPGLYWVLKLIFVLLGIVAFALMVQKFPFSSGTAGIYYLGEGEQLNRGTVKEEVK